MTQYHAHKNRDTASQKIYPFVLDVQAGLLSDLATRVVLPMRKLKDYPSKPITRLNPILKIEGVDYIVLAQQISVMPSKAVGQSHADFSAEQHTIVAAVDCVLSGL